MNNLNFKEDSKEILKSHNISTSAFQISRNCENQLILKEHDGKKLKNVTSFYPLSNDPIYNNQNRHLCNEKCSKICRLQANYFPVNRSEFDNSALIDNLNIHSNFETGITNYENNERFETSKYFHKSYDSNQNNDVFHFNNNQNNISFDKLYNENKEFAFQASKYDESERNKLINENRVQKNSKKFILNKNMFL